MPVPDTPYLNIATITKTHGRKGEVVVHSTTGRPFAIPEGSEVWLVPPILRGVNHSYITAVLGGGTDVRLTFEGIDDLDSADRLSGRDILVRRDVFPEPQRLPVLLIGRKVVCENYGDLGEIVEVISTPGNEVWEVVGSYGHVLVPVIPDCIKRIPRSVDEAISVRLLPGLVDGESIEKGERRP